MWDMCLANWEVEGDAGDTIYALKTEQFPDPEGNDWACLLFLFPVICTYALHFRGVEWGS